MKNKEQFDNSIKVLVKAYLEGTLLHLEVCACAVGNLIADGMIGPIIVVGWVKFV